jgi:two-component system nitrate/nitrite response regulator NarL
MSYEIYSGAFGQGVLTQRELEITWLVSQGLPNKAVAGQLGVQEGTVKLHLHNIYQKLGVSNRVGLLVKALADSSIYASAARKPQSEPLRPSGPGSASFKAQAA